MVLTTTIDELDAVVKAARQGLAVRNAFEQFERAMQEVPMSAANMMSEVALMRGLVAALRRALNQQ